MTHRSLLNPATLPPITLCARCGKPTAAPVAVPVFDEGGRPTVEPWCERCTRIVVIVREDDGEY